MVTRMVASRIPKRRRKSRKVVYRSDRLADIKINDTDDRAVVRIVYFESFGLIFLFVEGVD